MSTKSEFHNNHDCQHDVDYCKQCDEVYCVDCEMTWKEPCTQTHWGYNTTTEPYYGTLTTSASAPIGDNGTLITACSHDGA